MTSQPKLGAYQRLVGWLGDSFREQFAIYLALTVILVGLNEVVGFGTNIANWDPLYISGVLTLVIALRLAVEIPPKAHETLTRLANRGAIELTPMKLKAIHKKLETEAGRWAAWGGPIVAVAVLLGFYSVFRFEGQVFFTILATIGGFVAGRFLGRAAAYGQMGTLLKRESVTLHVQPGQLDGAGGFKPVGDLFFYQAFVIGLAAAFLAIWSLLIPLFPYYSRWRDVYVGLLAIAVLFEMLGFFGPMWSFHTAMRDLKAQLTKEADRWMEEIGRLQGQVVQAPPNADTKAQQERLALLIERCRAIDDLPTWPVDADIRRKFTVGNLGLFLPLLGYVIRVQTPDGQSVWSVLQGILEGLTKG